MFSLSLRKGDMRRLASIRINYFGVLIIFSRTNTINLADTERSLNNLVVKGERVDTCFFLPLRTLLIHFLIGSLSCFEITKL